MDHTVRDGLLEFLTRDSAENALIDRVKRVFVLERSEVAADLLDHRVELHKSLSRGLTECGAGASLVPTDRHQLLLLHDRLGILGRELGDA